MDKNVNFGNSDPRLFIPPVLSGFNLNPLSCELSRKKTVDGKKIVYTFSIALESVDSNSLFQSNNPTSINTVLTEKDLTKDVIAKPSKDEEKARKVFCDGACSRKYLPNCLITISECKHQLCPICVELVKLPDGAMSCSSFACTRKVMFNHLSSDEALRSYNHIIRTRCIENAAEKRKNNQISDTESYIYCYRQPSMVRLVDVISGSSKSPVTMSTAAERSPFTVYFNNSLDGNDIIRLFSSYRAQADKTMIPLIVLEHEKAKVNVLLILRDGNTSRRMLLSYEFPATCSLHKALSDCIGKWGSVLENDDCRIFYCDGINISSIRQLKSDEHREACLFSYKGLSGNLHFVVDSAGCVRL